MDAAALLVLATRWGKILGGINQANSFRGSSIDTRADSINVLYPDADEQRQVVDGLYTQRGVLRTAMDEWGTYLATLLGSTILAMEQDDTVRPVNTELDGLFRKLNLDMVNATPAQSFDLPTVTGTVASGTNIGDGYLLASVVEPVDGITTYFAYQEIIRFLCTADSYNNDTTAGLETWTVNGETAAANDAYDWPKGSGASATLTAITADSAGILTDPSWESWSGTGNNTPNAAWVTNGVSGTNIFRGSTLPYSGDYYMKVTGDGATTLRLWQVLDQTLLRSNTPFAVTFWVQVPAATLATATLRVALTDGSGNVLTNNLGTSLSQTTNTAGLNAATSWTQVRNVFTSPRSWPTELRLEFRFVGALDNAKSVYLDYVTLTPMTRLYDGGPFAALISGATPFAINDSFNYTVVNDPDGVLTPSQTFVRSLGRFFELPENGIRLTVNATGTLADNLIN